MDVKPLQVILILALFGGLLALGMWGATESRGIQGSSDLRIDRLGRLHVRIDDKIFVDNTASTLVDEYALTKFGIEQLYGSYEFYTDNSMLLSPASIQAAAASACVQLTIRVVAWSTVGLGMGVMLPVAGRQRVYYRLHNDTDGYATVVALRQKGTGAMA
jgi:hypothetical protein